MASRAVLANRAGNWIHLSDPDILLGPCSSRQQRYTYQIFPAHKPAQATREALSSSSLVYGPVTSLTQWTALLAGALELEDVRSDLWLKHHAKGTRSYAKVRI